MTTHFVLGVVTLAAGLSAQNMVQNGDFEDPTFGWTLNNYGINPAVESFDTTGAGGSQAYAVTPGWLNDQAQTTHSIERTISIVEGEVYEIRVDVAADWRGSQLSKSVQVVVRVVCS